MPHRDLANNPITAIASGAFASLTRIVDLYANTKKCIADYATPLTSFLWALPTVILPSNLFFGLPISTL